MPAADDEAGCGVALSQRCAGRTFSPRWLTAAGNSWRALEILPLHVLPLAVGRARLILNARVVRRALCPLARRQRPWLRSARLTRILLAWVLLPQILPRIGLSL
jgi:hypothetical protein